MSTSQQQGSRKKQGPLDDIVRQVRTFKPATIAKFKTELGQILRAAVKEGFFTTEQSADIASAIAMMEGWYGEAAPSRDEALRQHQTLSTAGPRGVPVKLTAALGSHLARLKGRIDWPLYFAGEIDAEYTRLLVELKVLKAADLVAVAKKSPEQFYMSRGLDLLLDQGKVPPRSAWNGLSAQAVRPTGLLPGAEALITAYALDPAADASKWLVTLLLRYDEQRAAFLRQLLKDRVAALRLLRYIAGLGVAPNGKRRKPDTIVESTLIPAWLPDIEAAIAGMKGTGENARALLGAIRMSVEGLPESFSVETRAAVADVCRRVLQDTLAKALLTMEAGSSVDRDVVVPVATSELYAATQAYLRSLRSTMGGEGGADRASSYERYLGRREVLAELLPLLDELPPDSYAHSSIEAILFNAGVSALGLSGAETTFDAHAHTTDSPDLIPGMPAVIVTTGWQLGDGTSAMVLKKAAVRQIS